MKKMEYSSPKYRWIYEQPDKAECEHISKTYDMLPALAEILVKRNLTTPKAIKDYFETPLNGLHNPFLMKDMDKGVDRVCKAIKNNEKICIYGDYDVDGVTSTSLMILFLNELGAKVMYYIPNRLEEGYGLNVEAIEELSQKKVNLIITVDCGTSAIDEVEFANSKGIDVVITDHHQTGSNIPNACAVINPMREGDEYPFKNLAGVGVAFKLCMAIRFHLRNDKTWTKELPNLKKYLDIVTLGTIADVVPLFGENRIFVMHGLIALSSDDTKPGISELKKVAGINSRSPVSAVHVGFGLAPRINAVGRLGNSDRGFRLITTTDKNEAKLLASELDQENKYRQSIERGILEQVFSMIEEQELDKKYKGLVLYAKNWHPGVLGIVASRVADKYYRPTIVLTEEVGQLKGSARSIPAFHLYDGLKELDELLLTFGGHKYAAGLKLMPEKIEELRERFDALVNAKLTDRDFIPELNIDAFLEPEYLNVKFMDKLKSFEPYGNSNKEPLFCMTGVEKYQETTFVGKDYSHAKCFFIKDKIVLNAIGYNFKHYKDLLLKPLKFDIIFTVNYDMYAKNRSVQLTLKDIRATDDL